MSSRISHILTDFFCGHTSETTKYHEQKNETLGTRFHLSSNPFIAEMLRIMSSITQKLNQTCGFPAVSAQNGTSKQTKFWRKIGKVVY